MHAAGRGGKHAAIIIIGMVPLDFRQSRGLVILHADSGMISAAKIQLSDRDVRYISQTLVPYNWLLHA